MKEAFSSVIREHVCGRGAAVGPGDSDGGGFGGCAVAGEIKQQARIINLKLSFFIVQQFILS